jgi:hypothetical protein
MGVSDEAKNVIPLKFLRKIKNKNFFPLVNSIRGHTVDRYIVYSNLLTATLVKLNHKMTKTKTLRASTFTGKFYDIYKKYECPSTIKYLREIHSTTSGYQ